MTAPSKLSDVVTNTRPASANHYFTWKTFPFTRPPELNGQGTHHQVAIVGAGPVGLALSLNLARYGVSSVILESRDAISDGSRAVAMNRRTMQILDRIGVGDRVMELVETWDRNSTYYGSDLVYEMEIPHPANEKHAPLNNLQQCWMEQIMVDAAADTGRIDIRWQTRVTGLDVADHGVTVDIDTPEGGYLLTADYLIACDGPRSTVRQALGLRFEGATFEKRYIICDFHMQVDLPMGRRAWFDPPYSRGSTILLHKTPFDVWRLDYQLREDEDPDLAQDPDVVKQRIRDHLAMMGVSAPWELIWISMYRAHALSLPRYDYGRVLFAGDAAHQVPIFGGRGLNHGYADTHNLAWKLAAVVDGRASASLLETYSDERHGALLDTIDDLTKITMYMTTPNSGIELMRDAVLSLSRSTDSVKQLFDPFRVTPWIHGESRLNGALHREAEFNAGPPAGLMAPDLPLIRDQVTTSLYDRAGTGFVGLYFAPANGIPEAHRVALTELKEEYGLDVVQLGGTGPNAWHDDGGAARKLFDAVEGTFYLLRPDDYVAARWRSFEPIEVRQALKTATGAS
jgi:3-(3-hydroxy-phenyl)propionate hydroxylase